MLTDRPELEEILVGLDLQAEAKQCVRRLDGLAARWRSSHCRNSSMFSEIIYFYIQIIM